VRHQYGGMKTDDAKRLKQFERLGAFKSGCGWGRFQGHANVIIADAESPLVLRHSRSRERPHGAVPAWSPPRQRERDCRSGRDSGAGALPLTTALLPPTPLN
jgi:hypothetical protein